MNKRRVETATSLFLLVFYIIYIASYFFFQLSNAHRRFSDYNYQLFNEAFRLENLCESGSISVDSLEYYARFSPPSSSNRFVKRKAAS